MTTILTSTASKIVFRKLSRTDNRTKFQSTNEQLNHFFRKNAGQNQFKHKISGTYLLTDEKDILAFVTLSPTVVERSLLMDKKLPRYPNLPALLIARMAVDYRHKRQGLGERLLKETGTLALKEATNFGCIGLITDAKEESIKFYQKYSFLEIGELENGTPKHFLSLKEIVTQQLHL